MTNDGMTAEDVYLSTADALGLTPRQRREGLDAIRAADLRIRQNLPREVFDADND